MKRVLFISCLLMVLSVPVFAARDEIHRTFELSPGASIDISGINGRVEISTGGGGTAELIIFREADDAADFDARPVDIDSDSGYLSIRVLNDKERRRRGNVRDNVELRIPDTAGSLDVSGVNGRVSAGYIEGAVRFSGINGPVTMAAGVGDVEASGINGAIRLELDRMGEAGIEMSGINGSITLDFGQSIGADVEVTGKNGSVKVDDSEVRVLEKTRKAYRAQVGGGGPPISISGVNGNITIRSGR